MANEISAICIAVTFIVVYKPRSETYNHCLLMDKIFLLSAAASKAHCGKVQSMTSDAVRSVAMDLWQPYCRAVPSDSVGLLPVL